MVDLVTAVSNASSVKVNVDPTAGATVAQIVNLQEQIDDVKSFVGYESSDVYGVEIDFPNRRFTRIAGAENLTAGADFDKLNPWGGRKRCILADDGTVLAYRGETGYTEAGATTVELKKTVDGAEKTYASGTKVQVMVEQPVFYVKAVPVSSKNATSGKGKQYTKGRFYISPTPKAGFTAPRAFYDNHGIVQDKIYLSAFEGCIYDTDAKKYLTADEQVADFATDMLSSIAGAKPASGLTQNLTRANVRKLCANRGAGWESHSIFAMAVTEWLLMIEYASLDAQRKVGRGVCDFTDDGKTNMAVVTGATSGLGNGSGIDPNGGVDGKCSVSYRGEENLWGNIWTWLDKVNILAKGQNEVFVHEIGATVADDTTTGYKSLRKYYPSIVHDVLKAKYRELFKDEELIWLMDEIIDSISTCPATEENIEILQRLGVAVNIIIDDNGREFVDGVGIPIGNYVSQYDGNFNLSVVDHWLKEVKGVKYYFRYMDDMVIFGSSKEELHKLKRELDEFMAVNLKQVLKHNWQVFPTKVRGVDFVGYRFFGEYTLLRKSTCKTFKRRMLSISSKRENNVSPTYSEWCSFNSYVGWLQHCDSFRLYQKYVEPNVEYMHNYYLKEVKGNAEICKRKNYSGERKAS